MKRLDRDGGIEVALAKAGSLTALARALGISLTAVTKWRQIPIARVAEIERLYGLRPWELRPDVWPPPRQRSSRRGRPRNF